jgi:hypothetical protein
MPRFALLILVLAVCAGTAPTAAAQSGSSRSVPAKCTACHLAPKEHGLASASWTRFSQNHRRRVRLTAEERTFLYDFLVGGQLPADEAQ